MTQMMDLNKMGLVPMGNFEMQGVEGGGLLEWVIEKCAEALGGYLLGGGYARDNMAIPGNGSFNHIAGM